MLRKTVRVTLILVFSLVIVMTGVILYICAALPNVGPAPDIRISATPERLARGKYLANSVSGCIACHSSRDGSRFSEPLITGTLGKGGEVFPTEAGQVVASNITPTHLGTWTDGEVFRAITCGVTKAGKPLFPLMPYPNFAKMDTEDVYSIIAYIRTLEPLPYTTSEVTHLNFPMNIIVHTIPSKAEPGTRPDTSNELEYGHYLVNAASCRECHSPMVKGKFIEEEEFSGGVAFTLSNGSRVHSGNITPDVETGIGSWSKDVFIQRFKIASSSSYMHPVKTGDEQTLMPWTMYATMTQRDLGAMYTYLKTVKPVKKAFIQN